MKKKWKYITTVAVLTRVNNFENKIWVAVCTKNTLHSKETKNKVKKYLLAEYGVEGAYDILITEDRITNARIIEESQIDKWLEAYPKTIML
jgi:S-adenosylhomocysteine hydrolase